MLTPRDLGRGELWGGNLRTFDPGDPGPSAPDVFGSFIDPALMDGYLRTVLVVEPNSTERERLAGALEGDGFQVLLCSGPTEPDYTCIGARTGTCPLATEDSVVVLDMSLESEMVVMGTCAEDLLGMYLASGHPVVVLGSRPGEEEPGRLLWLRRHPEKADIVAAVWRLASRQGMPSRGRTEWGITL